MGRGNGGPAPVDDLDLADVITEIDQLADIGDRIYGVRERAAEAAFEADPFYKGDTWDLPDVARYGDLCARLRVLLVEKRRREK